MTALDEPFADRSALPTYTGSELARELVSVVQSGDVGGKLVGGQARDRSVADHGSLLVPARAPVGAEPAQVGRWGGEVVVTARGYRVGAGGGAPEFEDRAAIRRLVVLDQWRSSHG